MNILKKQQRKINIEKRNKVNIFLHLKTRTVMLCKYLNDSYIVHTRILIIIVYFSIYAQILQTYVVDIYSNIIDIFKLQEEFIKETKILHF